MTSLILLVACAYDCDVEKQAHAFKWEDIRDLRDSLAQTQGKENPFNLQTVLDSWKTQKINMKDKSKFGCSAKVGEEYNVVCAFD
ncbi:hypothetical protein Y032_0020g71 [Ancylostoma ceylanicum]|uniref:SCP domain-containing protein n=1 Tax=Ancylostoma ceylanicum TaxID=53326 RepID=A0A016V1A6_9BILA|nr:hypothetical protein Y032_0020g71 [Ancylostoma ceylanicum]